MTVNYIDENKLIEKVHLINTNPFRCVSLTPAEFFTTVPECVSDTVWDVKKVGNRIIGRFLIAALTGTESADSSGRYLIGETRYRPLVDTPKALLSEIINPIPLRFSMVTKDGKVRVMGLEGNAVLPSLTVELDYVYNLEIL